MSKDKGQINLNDIGIPTDGAFFGAGFVPGGVLVACTCGLLYGGWNTRDLDPLTAAARDFLAIDRAQAKGAR